MIEHVMDVFSTEATSVTAEDRILEDIANAMYQFPINLF